MSESTPVSDRSSKFPLLVSGLLCVIVGTTTILSWGYAMAHYRKASHYDVTAMSSTVGYVNHIAYTKDMVVLVTGWIGFGAGLIALLGFTPYILIKLYQD